MKVGPGIGLQMNPCNAMGCQNLPVLRVQGGGSGVSIGGVMIVRV